MTVVVARPRDHVVGRYLGLTLVITERTVDVFRHDGRHIGTAYTVSGARRICRGYRSGSKR